MLPKGELWNGIERKSRDFVPTSLLQSPPFAVGAKSQLILRISPNIMSRQEYLISFFVFKQSFALPQQNYLIWIIFVTGIACLGVALGQFGGKNSLKFFYCSQKNIFLLLEWVGIKSSFRSSRTTWGWLPNICKGKGTKERLNGIIEYGYINMLGWDGLESTVGTGISRVDH